MGVATTAMQDIHIAKPPASTIGTIAEEGPMPSFHFGSDLAVSRQDARPQSSRVSTDPRPEEGSLVSKAFTAGAQRTAGSSTGFLNRLLSAGPAGNTPAVVTIKPAVRPPTLTEEDRGPTSGPLSDNGIFSATVDLDFRRKSGSLSRDGLACPPSPRPSGGGILDQMDRPSRPSTPLSPLRSPLPSPGGTASGFLRLQTSNPGTLTALRESFLAGSHRDMTLAEPQGHDAGGRLRQFGAKHGSGSEASTPLPSAMFQRMPAPWLKNIPPPSPIELTGRSFSLPRPETAQPSQPGAEYKSHSLQRRDSPEQPTPPPVPGASSNALRPTPPPPLLSPGSSGPKRRISTSAGTPTASLTAAPPPPPDMMEISPAQLHSSLPPARPSLIPDLPESVKADIFGSGGAPDKIHSTAIPGFTVGRVIGEGGFCQVRVGAHHLSAQKVAVKVVDKGKIEDADEEKMIRREIRTMKHLNGHSRIIRLYMTLENDQFIYIVMELATGGTLLDYIKKQKSLQKSEAARLLAQLVSGLDYCHKRGVVHRDIKLENVMTDDKNNLKIIDLGLCAFYQPGEIRA